MSLQAPLGLQLKADGYYYDGHDAMGRVTNAHQLTAGVSYITSYTYDLAGHMTQETYPSGHAVKTSYDRAGRISDVQRVGGTDYADSFSYAANGALTAMTLGNGLVEHTTYNVRFQPTLIGLGTSMNDSSVFQLDYTYGVLTGQAPNQTLDTTKNNGNIQSETITAGSGQTAMVESFTYDSLNRLAGATETATPSGQSTTTNWSRTFSYDQYGNMWVPGTGWSGIMPGSLTPQAQTDFNASTNRLVASGYDFSGNQTSDKSGSIYGYDAENHMTSCTVNGTSSSYDYDADGHRVAKTVSGTTTIFVYNVSGQLIAEYGGPTPTTTGTSYLTTDHLGSTRVITDSTSPTPNVLERDDYLPFGEEIGGNIGMGRNGVAGYSTSTDIHQKFTSKEQDPESSLDFFGARYCSAAQGRFTGVDPSSDGARSNDPQGWNGYTYVRNNPLIYVDDFGTDYDLYDKKGRLLGRVKDASQLEQLGYQYTGSNENGTRLEFKGGYYATYVEGDPGPAITTYATDLTPLALNTIDELGRSAKGSEHLIATFGIGTAAAGVTGGAGLYALTSTGAVGGLTTLDLSVALTSGEQGAIIGWGTGQSAEAVAQTEAVTNSLTPERAAEIERSVSKEWVQDQLAKYNRAIAEGGGRLKNAQLLPRKALMEKLLELWPNK